jgi:hypothetical protein
MTGDSTVPARASGQPLSQRDLMVIIDFQGIDHLR